MTTSWIDIGMLSGGAMLATLAFRMLTLKLLDLAIANPGATMQVLARCRCILSKRGDTNVPPAHSD